MAKNDKRKPRIPEIRVDFGKDVTISGMKEEDGQIIFFDENGNKVDPIQVETGMVYERKSKPPKSINRSKTKEEEIQISPVKKLLNYDWLFAIDTNSKNFEFGKVGVSCPIQVKFTIEGIKWNAGITDLPVLEFRSPKINPELIGWKNLIDKVLESPDYQSTHKVGIIVDSELENISDYNKRKIPLYDAFFLPENFELIYASSDVGKEYPPNQLISYCDKTSNEVLKLIESRNGKGYPLGKSEDLNYDNYVIWVMSKKTK